MIKVTIKSYGQSRTGNCVRLQQFQVEARPPAWALLTFLEPHEVYYTDRLQTLLYMARLTHGQSSPGGIKQATPKAGVKKIKMINFS